MVYETIIALRYLGSRKRNHFISVITVISCVGVAIGVWALIVVISVMAGFEGDLRGKILETYAHLLVDRPKGAIGQWQTLVPQLEQVEHVQGVSPFVRSEVMISSTINLAGVTLKGIRIEQAGVVNRLNKALEEGRLEYLDRPEQIPIPSFSATRLSTGNSGGGFIRSTEEAGGSAEPGPGAEQGTARVLAAATDSQPAQEDVPVAGEPGPALMPPLDLGEADQPRTLPGVLIGAELKKSLLVLVGDEVSIVSPLGDLGPSGPIPRTRTFRVAGVFFTGMYEYDSKMVYVSVKDAQQFLGQPDEVSGIELRVDDPDRAEVVASAIAAILARHSAPPTMSVPPAQPLRVRTWKVLNSSLFSALLLEKIAMFVILTLVTIVASFAIVASLIMVVLEKKKEVAILKALGAENLGIGRIFMTEGVAIGLIGTIFGEICGIATCLAVAHFGIPLDQEVYYIDRLPVEIQVLDIALIGASAVLISFLATLYPARMAARMMPAEGLRHE